MLVCVLGRRNCYKRTYISGSLLMSAMAAIGIPKLLAGPQKSAFKRQRKLLNKLSRKLHFTFPLLFSFASHLSNMVGVAVYFYYYYTTYKAVAAAVGERNG